VWEGTPADLWKDYNRFDTQPREPIIIGITDVFIFHKRFSSIQRFPYTYQSFHPPIKALGSAGIEISIKDTACIALSMIKVSGLLALIV